MELSDASVTAQRCFYTWQRLRWPYHERANETIGGCPKKKMMKMIACCFWAEPDLIYNVVLTSVFPSGGGRRFQCDQMAKLIILSIFGRLQQ